RCSFGSFGGGSAWSALGGAYVLLASAVVVGVASLVLLVMCSYLIYIKFFSSSPTVCPSSLL
ncbi:MAG: hypothetical protein IJ086_08620, partial [Clostridium sp.]|nr:hypothetical protein [Clostridium sp.]